MTEQYDSLNEKTKLIDIALLYTGGDMDKAKAMVAGQLDDIIGIKGKFYLSRNGQSGMFFSFFKFSCCH